MGIKKLDIEVKQPMRVRYAPPKYVKGRIKNPFRAFRKDKK